MNRVRKEGDGKESKGGRGEGEEGKEKNSLITLCIKVFSNCRKSRWVLDPPFPPSPPSPLPLTPPSPSLPSPHLPFKFVNSPSESVCTTVESIGPLPTVKA